LKLSEISPLPPAISAKDLPAGGTQIFNMYRNRSLNRHPVKIDEDSPPERILDTGDWLNSNGELGNPNDTDHDRVADVESDIEQGNVIE